jgi:hypothetical protein
MFKLETIIDKSRAYNERSQWQHVEISDPYVEKSEPYGEK